MIPALLGLSEFLNDLLDRHSVDLLAFKTLLDSWGLLSGAFVNIDLERHRRHVCLLESSELLSGLLDQEQLATALVGSLLDLGLEFVHLVFETLLVVPDDLVDSVADELVVCLGLGLLGCKLLLAGSLGSVKLAVELDRVKSLSLVNRVSVYSDFTHLDGDVLGLCEPLSLLLHPED